MGRERETILGGAVCLRAVWIEARLLSINSGDGGRRKGAGSSLTRDGAKKIRPNLAVGGGRDAAVWEGKNRIWD